jgi:sarcosine oxidase delta subunit
MRDQISGFLFDNYAIAGLEFENWMWLLACRRWLFLGIFSSADFTGRPAIRQVIHPADNSRAAAKPW